MRTCVIALVVLFVLLALPMALYAQETDLEAVVTAFYEAFNAGDVDGFVFLFADRAILNIVPFGTHTGKEEIRAYGEGLVALNATMEHEILRVEGDTVTVSAWYSDDDLRALGLRLEGIGEFTIQDGKITADTWTATDESLAALQGAMATLPETGGEVLPVNAVSMVLGGLSVTCGLVMELLRRRSCQTR